MFNKQLRFYSYAYMFCWALMCYNDYQKVLSWKCRIFYSFHNTPAFYFMALLKWRAGSDPLIHWDFHVLGDIYHLLCVVAVCSIRFQAPWGLSPSTWPKRNSCQYLWIKETKCNIEPNSGKKDLSHQPPWKYIDFFEDSLKYKSRLFYFQRDWKYAGNTQRKKDFLTFEFLYPIATG